MMDWLTAARNCIPEILYTRNKKQAVEREADLQERLDKLVDDVEEGLSTVEKRRIKRLLADQRFVRFRRDS